LKAKPPESKVKLPKFSKLEMEIIMQQAAEMLNWLPTKPDVYKAAFNENPPSRRLARRKHWTARPLGKRK
jgi:hypothetical protein